MLIRDYLFPLIKKFKRLFAAMVVILTLGVVLLMASVNAVNNVKRTSDDYYNRYGYPDVCLSLDGNIGEELYSKVASIDGIKKIETRLSYNVNGRVNDNYVVFQIKSHSADQIFKPYFCSEAEYKENEVNVYLDFKFAETNGIEAGEYIDLRITDEYYIKCYVQKIFSSPETTFFVLNEMVSTNKYSYACVYVEESELENKNIPEEYKSYLKYRNEFLINTYDGVDNTFVMERVKKLAEGSSLGVTNFYTRESSSTVKTLDNYINSLSAISTVIPSVFFAVAVIIIFLFLMQIIKSESREIGIMMTLGIHKTQIFIMLAAFSLIISIVAIILGAVFSIPMTSWVQHIILMGNILPYSFKSYDMGLFFIVFAITVLSGQIATFFASFLLLKMTPVECMYANDEMEGKIHRFREKVIGGLPNFTKLVYHLIVSNKRRLITSIFAYVATFVLIFIAMSVITSENYLLKSYKEDRLNYDVQIMVFDDFEENAKEDLASFSAIGRLEEVDVCEVNITYKNKKFNSIGAVLQDGHEFIVVKDWKNRLIPFYGEGIVLESYAASALGVKVGDFVTVNNQEADVKAISFQGSSKVQILSPSLMEELNVPFYKTYLASCNDRNRLLEHIFEKDYTAYCTFTSDEYKIIAEDCSVHKMVSIMIMCFAVMIGFIIICLMNQASFVEQKRKISIMRLLGYKATHVGVLWLFQFIVQFLISLVFSVPIGIFASTTILNFMTSDLYTYPFISEPITYLIAIGLSIIFYLIVHVITIGTVRRFNIADNTRNRE